MSYIPIKNENLKMPYGSGRLPIKVSLTDETLDNLEAVGVIEREQSTNGRTVAKRGGYGSALAEVSLRLVFDLLDRESTGETARFLYSMVDKEDLIVIIDNLNKINSILKQRWDKFSREKGSAQEFVKKINTNILREKPSEEMLGDIADVDVNIDKLIDSADIGNVLSDLYKKIEL